MDNMKQNQETETTRKMTTACGGWNEIETEDGNCGICGEHMNQTTRQPVALPACGHTFCRSCLADLMRTCGSNFPCPTCRTSHRGEDVANLPTNYLVLSLLSQDKYRKLANETPDKLAVKKRINRCFTEEKNDLSHPLLVQPKGMELKQIITTENDSISGDTSVEAKEVNIPYERQEHSDEDNASRGTKTVTGSDGRWRRWQISYKTKMCLVSMAVILVLMCLGAGVTIGIVPAILNHLGFSKSGVSKGSYASRLMSSTSRQNNGTIPIDSMVSWLQTAGYRGLSREHQTYFGLTGAGIVLISAVVVLGVVMLVRRCVAKRRGSSHSDTH